MWCCQIDDATIDGVVTSAMCYGFGSVRSICTYVQHKFYIHSIN